MAEIAEGILESYSAEDTWEIGRRMGEMAVPGQVITLTGDLGTGKTVFTKGFAAGLGISEVSDSFTIIVSEETGRVSYAYHGVLTTGVTASGLREELHQIQKRAARENGDRISRFRKGRKTE